MPRRVASAPLRAITGVRARFELLRNRCRESRWNQMTRPKKVPPVAPSEEVRLAAVQEELAVGVKMTETGSVRVRKIVREETQAVSTQLLSEHVEVTRVAVNCPAEKRREPRREGDTLIIPVYEY